MDIKEYNLTKSDTLEHIISCFPSCDVFNIKKYHYVDINGFRYFYNKKKYTSALTFSLFHTFDYDDNSIIEYGIIIKYENWHDEWTKAALGGDISPALQIIKKIISDCRR